MSAILSASAASSRGRTLLLAVAVACAAAGAILGGTLAQGGWLWLHWAAKPLATLLLLAAAMFAWVPVSPRYRAWIVAGMVCSLIGDVLLMLPQDLFVPGLLAFLLGHLCFITAFLDDSRIAAHPSAWLACLLVGGLNLWLLWPSIAPALRIAVMVYALVLSSMGGLAIARAWSHATARDWLGVSARRAALGGVLFMLSDSLLAWNRFHGALPLATLWILGSYYVALWCIARSVARDDSSNHLGARS
jgi:uncharacterized membrane protein YhhN